MKVFIPLCVAAMLVPGGGTDQDQPMFRTAVAGVTVPVSVHAGKRAVSGLAASDFVVTDNGVRQDVTVTTGAQLPVDLTLVVDVSGSTHSRLERYRSDVREIASLLGPVDRLRVLSFGTSVTEVIPLQAPANDLPVEQLVTSGLTSMQDAVAAALMRRADAGRAHLVLVFGDGDDTFSIVAVDTLESIARLSDAVVYLSLRPVGRVERARGLPLALYRGGGPVDERARLGVAPERDVARRLAQAAESTGGRRIADGFVRASLRDALGQVLEEFRSSYVLTFTPTGVSPTGWHELRVSIGRPGNHSVRARRGYFAGR